MVVILDLNTLTTVTFVWEYLTGIKVYSNGTVLVSPGHSFTDGNNQCRIILVQ